MATSTNPQSEKRRPDNVESLDSNHDIVLIPNDKQFDTFNFSKTTILIISVIILLLLLIFLVVNDTTFSYVL